jgi:hypothetical protein
MRAASSRVHEQLLQSGRESFESADCGAAALKIELEELESNVPYAPEATLRNSYQNAIVGLGGLSTELGQDGDPSTTQGLPPLPASDIAAGFLWPSHGRDVLRLVERERATHRSDLNANSGYGDGSGGTDTLVFQAGAYCLKTSRRRSTKDLDEGRARLLALARSKVMLGSLVLQGTVVSLHRGRGDDYWLWTTTPWLPTLRHLMQNAVAGQERDGLGEALGLYAETIVRSLEMAVRVGIVLDVHPSNFVVQDEKVYYIDDDVVLGSIVPTLGYAILRRVEEYSAFPEVIEDYVNRVIIGMLERMTQEERSLLDLHSIVRDTLVRSEAAQTAKQLILGAICVA